MTAIDASFAAVVTLGPVDHDHFAAAAAAVGQRYVQRPNCYGSLRFPIRCTRLGTIQTIEFEDFRRIANLWHVRLPMRCDRVRGMSIDSHPTPDTSKERERLDVDRILWLQMQEKRCMIEKIKNIFPKLLTLNRSRCQVEFGFGARHMHGRTIHDIAQ